jgi:hypothetical protein
MTNIDDEARKKRIILDILDLINKSKYLQMKNLYTDDKDIVYLYAINFYNDTDIPEDWYKIHKQNMHVIFNWDFNKPIYYQELDVLIKYLSHIKIIGKDFI